MKINSILYLVIIIFFNALNYCNGQISESEKIKIKSRLEEILDSARRSINLDPSLNEVNKQIAFITNNQSIDHKLLFYGLYVKGKIYEYKNEYDKMYEVLDSATRISVIYHLDYGFDYAKCLQSFAASAIYSNHSEKALFPLIRSIEIFNKLNKKDYLLNSKSLQIDYYYTTSQYTEAEDLINETEQSLDSSYSQSFISYFFYHVSNFYNKLGIKDKAQIYLSKYQADSEVNQCHNLFFKLEQSTGNNDSVGGIILLPQCIACNNKLFSNELNLFAGNLNIISEAIITNKLKDIQVADSILNIVSQKLNINELNLSTIRNTDSLKNITSYLVLKSEIALKKSDLLTLGSIVNRIEVLTEEFTNFQNLTSKQIELLLLVTSHYYYEIKDTRLVKVLYKYKEIKKKKLNDALNFMTELELNQFIQNKLYSNVDIFFNLYSPNLMPENYSNFLYELALYSKGLMFRKNRGINKLLNESTDSSIVKLKNEIYNLDAKISSIEQSKNIILFKIRDNLERQAIKALNSIIKEDSFDVSLIQNKLKKDEVAIEFIKHVSIFNDTITEKYSALILDSLNSNPRLIPLFEEKELSQFNDNKLDILDSSNFNISRGYGLSPLKSKEINEYKIIWEPILKAYPFVKTIYFSPTGILNKMNHSCFLISDSTYLFDKIRMIQLSSTYNIINNHKDSFSKISSSLLIGGIDYGEKNKVSNINNNHVWNYLEETLKEVKYLKNKFSRSKINTTLLTGVDANETNVRLKLSQKNEIIHLATHGHYKDLDKSSIQYDYLSANPLSRSILVLANANNSDKISKSTNDGYLNALEISYLDLSFANLVVLSACETALGDNLSRFESSYSLIRGFKIAGAKSVISTIWPVEDKIAFSFMKIFYNYLIEKSMNRNDAFINTQKKMRTIYPDNPNWKAFILID